jgi:hypothetical protein
MLASKVTVVVGVPSEAFDRSTNRYSIRAVQLSANATSTPAPAVQPAFDALAKVLLVAPLAPCSILPKAPPAVP